MSRDWPPRLTEIEYDALAGAMALAEAEWEDSRPKAVAALHRAGRKVWAWHSGMQGTGKHRSRNGE